jgi:hypothetical protein
LLEEHPLQHLGACEWIRGEQGGAVRQVPQDRIRFGEAPAIVEFQQRNTAVGVDGVRVSPRMMSSST